MLKKILLLVAATVSAFAMNRGEININNKDLEIGAQFDVGQFNPAVEPDTTFVGGKFLNADKEHSGDKNASKFNSYFEANFLMLQPVGKAGMSFGMGVKLNYTKEFASLPLGIEFVYKIPSKAYVPMFITGEFYYAPTALAFKQANNFLEYRLGYDIEIIKNGNIIFGYRKVETNYKSTTSYHTNSGDFTYNSSWYVGFKIGF